MEQYIPKSALVAEIERIKKEECPINTYEGRNKLFYFERFLSFINHLEVKEVDLNKELSYEDYKGFFEKYPDLSDEWGFDEAWMFANYFFKLGLNVSNPITEVNLESLVRQVIGLYLEAGEHYNSVIKEERKEYGGSDLAIKLFDGVIDAKELSIQYVLDKLKAQKGE